MRRFHRKESLAENQENAFNLSISDLMAGILSIFMLAVCYFMLNLGQVKDQYTGNMEMRDDMLEEIKAELDQRGTTVKVDKKQGVLRIEGDFLFNTGEAHVKESGRQDILNLAHVLYQVLEKEKYKNAIETIFIEGHTDNVDIETPEFPSNWELSTQRAINTWKLMYQDQVASPLDKEKNANGEPIFSCSGYADTRPVTENDTEEGRQANRRIALRFTMMPPTDTARESEKKE